MVRSPDIFVAVPVAMCIAVACGSEPLNVAALDGRRTGDSAAGMQAGGGASGTDAVFGGGAGTTSAAAGSAGAGGVTAPSGGTSGTAAPGGNAGTAGRSGAVTGLGGAPGSACPCTRRLDAPTSSKCPRGADESVTMRVGPEGGILKLSGQQARASGVAFELHIPPRALANAVAITVTELREPPPAGFSDWSPLYRVEPAGLVLNGAAALRVPWSNVDGEVNRALTTYAAPTSAGPYEPLSDSYVNAGFTQASLHRLGFLFVGAPASTVSTTCTGSCSVVGTWDGISFGYGTKPETRASYRFAADGTWIGGRYREDVVATQFMGGTYRQAGSAFEILTSEGMGCPSDYSAGFNATFDPACGMLQLGHRHDNCTGGRNYLMPDGNELVRRR